jgi:hypothetical protein
VFRKKAVNDVSLDAKSEHKLASFGNITSIFKGNSDSASAESDPIIHPDNQYVPLEADVVKPSTNKAVKLIQEVQKLEDRTIKPFVDYNEGVLLMLHVLMI